MTQKQLLVDEMICKMNLDHYKLDSNGNTGDYRVATHDGADYAYVSDFYGIAMSTIRIDCLSDEQCDAILNHMSINVAIPS